MSGTSASTATVTGISSINQICLLTLQGSGLFGVPGIAAMDAGKGVEGHAVALEQFGGTEDLVEGGAAAFGDPALIVQLARAINAQPHEEVVGLQEARPVLVEHDRARRRG